MQIKALRKWHALARALLKKTRVAQSGAHAFFYFHLESIMKNALSSLALGAVLLTSAVAASAAVDTSAHRFDALVAAAEKAAATDDAATVARRGRGADDGAGHQRRGRGADDGANHARRGRGADDGVGHQRRGRGADDGANHT